MGDWELQEPHRFAKQAIITGPGDVVLYLDTDDVPRDEVLATARQMVATLNGEDPEAERARREEAQRRAEIERVLEALGEMWNRYPQLRLGQLVTKLAGSGSVFYLPDLEAERRMRPGSDIDQAIQAIGRD